LGPKNVYKDMLNNMVNPIDHVVMNHQNQTRTNDIWGHVRYKAIEQLQ
jgi:DNA-binding protein Fis